jgi:hypothetical protein
LVPITHLPLVPCEDIVSMETQQIHLSEGYITPPRVLGPFDPMQTPEQPHDILARVDTTIDSSFKLLQQDQSHASSRTPHPPYLVSPIYFKLLSPIPPPFTLHHNWLSRNVTTTQTSTLTYVSYVVPTIVLPPSRTQPSTPPTGGKPFFTPLFLGGDPNLFGQQPSTGGLPPQGIQLMGFGQKISMSQPFTGGQPLYPGQMSNQHLAGGKPSNF